MTVAPSVRDRRPGLAGDQCRRLRGPPRTGPARAARPRRPFAQDWFDPADFLLVVSATEPDAVAAYHWTKVTLRPAATRPGSAARSTSSVSIPGGRVGGSRSRSPWPGCTTCASGVATAHLYVDDDNTRAVATYRRLGFAVEVTDRQYAWV